MNRIDRINAISDKLGATELYASLAGKSKKLAQASLKLLWASTLLQDSTTVPLDETRKKLVDEVADVFVVLYAIGALDDSDIDKSGFGVIADEKIEKWAKRLGVEK